MGPKSIDQYAAFPRENVGKTQECSLHGSSPFSIVRDAHNELVSYIKVEKRNFLFLKCIVQLAICSKVSECVEPTRSFTTRKCISGKRLQCNAGTSFATRKCLTTHANRSAFPFPLEQKITWSGSAVQCSAVEVRRSNKGKALVKMSHSQRNRKNEAKSHGCT